MVASASASLLASPSRLELLHLLQQGGPSTIDVLARATGLHQNTVREHLARLADGGYVVGEPEIRSTRGRPRIVYRATRAADVIQDPEALRRLERSIAQAALTRALVGAFPVRDQSGAATHAGREVGARLPIPTPVAGATRATDAADPTDPNDADPTAPADPTAAAGRQLLALEAHLDAFGFDPVLEQVATTFHLWRCPFLELARERPDVVCSVHAGLAQGVLDQSGDAYEVEALTPFVGPGHCTLALRRR
ncbi:helix-turn-helix domain-containing protein [Miniimonas arenae]|uniref:Helix-turn-helix domain-containing protein n=1 Tax=Miniimonas arenae TaxID=676201 RepID=A0A5C5B9U6_9MICO|nr:helix-turn-helix domain-containing protein [Miniimonas arenae]TNU72746.1 helix-turn-helix domain-containing protein [Miniimonas arenae]